MASLLEESKAYEPPKTKNIADLEVVSVTSEIVEREFTKQDGTTFTMKVIVYEGGEYRVPTSVLKSLKAIAEEKPDLKFVKVKRTGEGLKTEYTVIPVE